MEDVVLNAEHSGMAFEALSLYCGFQPSNWISGAEYFLGLWYAATQKQKEAQGFSLSLSSQGWHTNGGVLIM